MASPSLHDRRAGRKKPAFVDEPLAWGEASSWATAELKKASDWGLIPDSLLGADMTKLITRAEFAAICVKVYENLSDTKAEPVATNPFSGCNGPDVLKALNIGVTNGTSPTKRAAGLILPGTLSKLHNFSIGISARKELTVRTVPLVLLMKSQNLTSAMEIVYNYYVNVYGNNYFNNRYIISAASMFRTIGSFRVLAYY